jgi:hypothetical protein
VGLTSQANPVRAVFSGSTKVSWSNRFRLPMRGKDGNAGRRNWARWMQRRARSSSECKPRLETRENWSQEWEQRGDVLRLLHSGQTHQFHQQRGLRAKTDPLDAMTIATMLLARGGTGRLCARASKSRPPEKCSACIRNSPMRQQLTRMRSRPWWLYSFQR